MVLVVWHGHACVEVRRGDGYTIVFDPHDGASLGLRKPAVKADLVLVSHEHFDHNAVDVVAKPGARAIRMKPGEEEVDGIRILGLESYHDKSRGSERGPNVIYVVEVEGKRIAHLGDLGDKPGPEAMEQLKGLDLLITPVGGTFTITAREAWELVEELKPLNVLPIHYRIPGLRLPIAPVDEFLVLVRGYKIERLEGNSFNLEEYSGAVLVPRPP